MEKEARRLIKEVRGWPGWRVEKCADGYKCYPPNGTRPIPIHTSKGFMSERGKANTIAQLRRGNRPVE